MSGMLAHVSPGVWAVILVVVGAPLAAVIKGRFDRWLKRDELDATAQTTEETQVRADLKAERDNSAVLRSEMTVLREEADRERDLRVAEAEKYNQKAQAFLDDISNARNALRQSYNDSEDQRRAHETAMNAQREEHAKQMAAMRDQHNADLNRRDARIVVLEQWITAGNPPPPPPWEEAP